MRASSLRLPGLALLLASVACGSPCGDLADRICSCQPPGALQDSCKSSASALLGSTSASAADEAYCTQKLKDCPDPTTHYGECEFLNTAAGKAQCGLALP